MRDKRKNPRIDLRSEARHPIETEILNGTDHGIVVTSQLPLVRRRRYRIESGSSRVAASVEATVMWSRQVSAQPRYQVGFRWAEALEPESQQILLSSTTLRVSPLGGGMVGRIPWQNDFIRNAPPDRAFIARELSLSGMLMETAEVDPPGDTFAVEIPVGDQPFRCLGRIVRTTPRKAKREGFLHGVEFFDVDADDLDRLRDLLSPEG